MNDLHGKILGEYTLLERIAQGGMSDVYRAKRADGTDVAFKVLEVNPSEPDHEVSIARFEREAQIVMELQHPHIVPIIDFGRDGNFLFIVMRLIEGGNLWDAIRQRPIPMQEASQWVMQLASALDYAHKMQIIHRDLKPSNILLDEQERAYLTDFGIARFANSVREMTEPGVVIGTPAYMSPEQWRAELLDARTDVYGLGVITYLMLSQHTPFETETPHQMMYQHLNQQVPSLRHYLPDVPLAVDHVVSKALSKHPSQRQPSAGAFARDFQDAITGKLKIEMPPPVYAGYKNTLPPVKKSRWRMGVAVMVLILMIAGGTVVMGARNLLEDNFIASATPQVTRDTRPLDVPRVRIDNPIPANPDEGLTIGMGTPLEIKVSAFDTQGVTRIELRHQNIMLQQIESPAAETRLTVALIFEPQQTGSYWLEIVAYRGDLKGDPRFLLVKVE